MTDLPGQEAELRDLRRKFLLTLISRAKSLHRSQPLPKSYFIGQEYVEDANRLNCSIVVAFIFPALIESIVFWHRKNRIVIQQHPPILTIEINRKISGRLWDDLRLFQRGRQFVLGYINALMPAINRRLLDNRYLSGQLLSRTFFVLEATGIFVACESEKVRLRWPVTVSPFPRSAQLAPGRAETYLRDFVDAIHAFLKNDFDDCIRRLVTSTENFFTLRKWTAIVGPNTFRRILDNNVQTGALAGQVVVENLKFVYHIRNRIVHQGFRMSTSSGLFCDKAIATLRYLLQGYSGDVSIARYANSLGMQLLMLQGIVGNGYDLDRIERAHFVPPSNAQAIQDLSAFDEFMFTSLRFTAQDKSSIV